MPRAERLLLVAGAFFFAMVMVNLFTGAWLFLWMMLGFLWAVLQLQPAPLGMPPPHRLIGDRWLCTSCGEWSLDLYIFDCRCPCHPRTDDDL